MKRVLVSGIIMLVLTTQGQSQVLTKKEKIKSLFALMHQDSLTIKTMDGMASMMVKNMAAVFNDTTYTNNGIDVSKWAQKLMEKSMAKSKEIALKLVNEDMVNIYDKYFTTEEIDDFIGFYKSRSGQKLLAQTPDITKDVMAIMTTKYQADFQQSFVKEVQEIIKEMEKEMKTK